MTPSDEQRVDLIQSDVDGELPDSRRADLARLLLADPEARALRDELGRVAQALGKVPSAEPPQGFREAVLDRLPLRPGTGAVARRGGRVRSAQRYAAAFAAGALLVMGLHELNGRSGTELDRSALSGTMARPATHRAPGTTTLQLDLARVHGSVSVHGATDPRTIEFNFRSSDPIEVVAEVGGRESRYRLAVLGRESVTGTYDLAGPPSAEIRLKVYSAGTLLHEATLAPTP